MRPGPRPAATVRRGRGPALTAVLLATATVLAACGGGGGGDRGAYVAAYERGCTALVGAGDAYSTALGTLAQRSPIIGEASVVREARAPVRALLGATAEAYRGLAAAEAPDEWRAFQAHFAANARQAVPALEDGARAVGRAVTRADVQRATDALDRVDPGLGRGPVAVRVPDGLLRAAPACRVLASGASG